MSSKGLSGRCQPWGAWRIAQGVIIGAVAKLLSRDHTRALWERSAGAHLILENNVESVDDTGNVTKDGQADVNAEVSTTATLQKDTHGREDDGKEDFANVAGGERHVGGCEVPPMDRQSRSN